jgi:hypothetical protein
MGWNPYLKTINIYENKLGVDHPSTINVKQYLENMLKKING